LKLSILHRVVLGLCLVVVAFAIALAYTINTQRALVTRLSRVADGYVALMRALDELSRDARTYARIVDETDPVILRQSLRASTALFPLHARIDAHFDTIDARLGPLQASALAPRERAFLTNVAALVADLQLEYVRAVRAGDDLLAAIEDRRDDVDALRRALRDRLATFDRRLEELVGLVEQQTDAEIRGVRADEERVLPRVLGATSAAIVVAFLVLLFIRRSLRPVRLLTDAASRLKRGDYVVDIFPTSRDEIGTLAAEFSSMALALRERDEELRSQHVALERAYRELFEAQRARVEAERLAAIGEMSSRITHELRNPLSSIGLNVEMLNDELLPTTTTDEAREMLSAIEREVQRLADLTEGYLDMARRRELSDEVQLDELMRSVGQQLSQEFGRKEIALTFADVESARVTGDEDRLRQLLLNLIQNAAQAAGRLGSVQLSCRVRDTDVLLAVEDSGPGVPEAERETIFDAFYTTRGTGTGLGLTICRDIVTMHGGDITAGAGHSLSGARFEVRLPRDDHSEHPEHATA